MDEFTALAQQVAVGAGDVRGCLIVSRDGLILGGFPAGDEAVAKPAWLRFATLGEPQKGFVEFPDQLWAYVHRGPYAAFAVAEPSVRPGLLMDRLEQALLSAEEARTRREPIRVVESLAPSGKPRTPLHPATPEPAQGREVASAEVPVIAAASPAVEIERGTSIGAGVGPTGGATEEVVAEPPVVVKAAPATVDEPGYAGAGPSETSTDEPASDAVRPPDPEPDVPMVDASAPATAGARQPQRALNGDDPGDETEVDRVLLAKEFSGLLQMDEDLDDAGS